MTDDARRWTLRCGEYFLLERTDEPRGWVNSGIKGVPEIGDLVSAPTGPTFWVRP